jgi:cytochrome c-type biogenesis protein CcmH/NrfG
MVASVGGVSVQPEDRREREVIREPVREREVIREPVREREVIREPAARTTVSDRMDSGRLIAAVVAIIVVLLIGYLLVTNLG